jgi:dolichyl-phosphate-mannose-protein mannosyltransferase
MHPVLVIVAVTAFAGGLRFYHLSTPHTYVFDEVYYAKDGCYDAGFPYKDCKLDHPGEQTVTVHPPLGRWIIAGGEAAFGNRPFGWRFSSAVAGTLSVALLAILAYVLFHSVLWAGVAGLLLAAENLNFVQSRVSMLDIFVALFVVAGMLFLVLDKRWIDRRTGRALAAPTDDRSPATLDDPIDASPAAETDEDLLLPPDRPPSPIFRPWRVACGVALGAATATKWSGGTALVGALVISLGWERGRRSDIGLENPLWETIRDEGFGIFLFLVILPIAIYLASYARWFADHSVNFGDWWNLQESMAKFSINLRAKHPYASPAWSWILLKRPVAYYYVCGEPCRRPAEIIGLGNPLIFWGSIPALVYATMAWLRGVRRNPLARSAGQSLLVSVGSVVVFNVVFAGLAGGTGYHWTLKSAEKASLVVAVAVFGAFFLMLLASLGRWTASFVVLAVVWQYAPWFFAKRTNFLFYMTPITPFLVLAVVYALKDLSEVHIGLDRVRALAPIAGFLVVAAFGLFVFFLPVLTGAPISYEMWRARMWFPSWI